MDLRATIEELAYSFANEVLAAIRQTPMLLLATPTPATPRQVAAPRPRRPRKAKPSLNRRSETYMENVENLHETIEKLKAKRITLGLSQRELGERIGIKQPHVANVERHHSAPGPALLARWHKALRG